MKMKYRFDVIYQPKYFAEASKLMRTMDLDIGEVGIKETVVFEANDMDINKIKETLTKAFESGGLGVLHIEGGKVE